MTREILQERNGKYPPPAGLSNGAYIKSFDEYKRMYERSVKDREAFWGEKAEEFLTWSKKWDKVVDEDLVNGKIEWFKNGKLNVSYNCLDRHLEKRGDQTAIIWEGNEPTEDRVITYRQLWEQVNHFANVLKKRGVKKGDRVTLYMPMVPELPIAMLACARIGAPHSIVFGGFSSDSLRDRVQDAESTIMITSDGLFRGKKSVPLKAAADEAAKQCPTLKTMIVLKRTGQPIEMEEGRDFWWHEEMADPAVQAECKPEEMDAEDPLFLLYTSGSTGKPKGVLHTSAGYLLFAAMTQKYVFDYHEGDVFWCTADIGWVTGHSYIVYGPLANGAITLMFEGVPSYPDFGRFWAVIDKWKVNQFYTAPTAIRACMKEGDDWVTKYNLSSLRILGTVGEPINPEAWIWYHKLVGRES
ncbi:MAG: AMP-binding protein, partial [Candidatus Thermoplasmatota archaeon]|nr:AMP-binding protein [Candidatus Thermoplasmatota archaeon]